MSLRAPQKQRLFLRGVFFRFDDTNPQIIPLPPEDAHHLLNVLRLPYDTSLDVVCADTSELAEGILCNHNNIASIKLLRPLENTRSNIAIDVRLLIALCKGQKNELIVDWATELGCSQILFWQSSRSVLRLKNSIDAKRKEERYQKIAQSAAQQSKQTILPSVSVHLSLAEALTSIEASIPDTRLICSLESHASTLQSAIADPTGLQAAIIAVGPEGDFAPEESQALIDEKGFTPLSLGSATLRSELAVVSAILSVRHRAAPH